MEPGVYVVPSLPIIPQLSEGRQTTEETQCGVRLQCGTRAISRQSKRVPFDTRLDVIQRLGRDTLAVVEVKVRVNG